MFELIELSEKILILMEGKNTSYISSIWFIWDKPAK